MIDTPLPPSRVRMLAGLMTLDAEASSHWPPEELGAILRHQLAAPLAYDLRTVAAGGEPTIHAMALTVVGAPPPTSFGDLIAHATPPVELLRLMKQFSRTARENGTLPAEVATILYYAAIGAAMTRLGTRITELDDGSLGKGMEWCIAQRWLEPAITQFFQSVLSKGQWAQK